MTLKKYLKENDTSSTLKIINSNPLLKSAMEIVQTLSKYGQALIVGGAVRDILMGKSNVHDVDIATNVPMDTIERLYPSHDIGKNKDFGIVVVRKDGYDFEIAQFRSESGYSDGRRPDSVKREKDFKKDAERRDFTINAMGIDKDGNVIDHFGGKNDIASKTLKTVGNPEDRFSEDYLRMLRAVRFKSKLGMNMDQDTEKAIQKNAKKISGLAGERITKEILSMAEQPGEKFADAIETLDKVGLLEILFPEVTRMKQYRHSKETHPEGDVYPHVIAAIKSSKINDPVTNLAILLHDIGKPDSYALENGKISYYDHAKKGLDIVNVIADRMKLSNEQREAILFATENHMKMHEILQMSHSKVMQLIKNKNWKVLYDVAYADDAARGTIDQEHWKKVNELVAELSEKLKKELSTEGLKKIVNGNLIMEIRKCKPGPEVGHVVEKTLEWILDNNIDVQDSARIRDFIARVPYEKLKLKEEILYLAGIR